MTISEGRGIEAGPFASGAPSAGTRKMCFVTVSEADG